MFFSHAQRTAYPPALAMAASSTLASIIVVNIRSSTFSGLAASQLRRLRTLAVVQPFKKSEASLLWPSPRRSRALASDSSALSEFAASSPNCYPTYHRLLPCPSENGPPRVEHLVVSEGGPVLEYISKKLNLPPLYVVDLIHFGAVYYALVCPKPPPSATAEEIRIYMEATSPSVLKKRSSIKGKTVREAQKTFKITRTDEVVEAGTYLRVHVHPKRFPRCYEIDWQSRIIAVSDSYVVLDKPAGTSVGGTTDNIEESCATFATRALGFTDPLKTTHQIDNCTEGWCSS